MIVEIFRGVSWVEAQIRTRLGVSYNVLLAVGLVIEIIKHVQEAGEHHDTGIIRSVMAIILFAALLLHQLSELAEHIERRLGKREVS